MDQSADDISPIQYLGTSGGKTRNKSDHIHYNLSQQLTGSYQKTRNLVGANASSSGFQQQLTAEQDQK